MYHTLNEQSFRMFTYSPHMIHPIETHFWPRIHLIPRLVENDCFEPGGSGSRLERSRMVTDPKAVARPVWILFDNCLCLSELARNSQSTRSDLV